MPSTPAPSAAAVASRERRVGVAILVVAVAVGAWLWTRDASAPRRPSDSDAVLVDEVLVATAGSPPVASLRVLVRDPAVLSITIEDADGAVVSFGPERPVEHGPSADPAVATRWTVVAGARQRDVPAYGTGLHVLRVEGAPRPRVHIVDRAWREGAK
jgi:hypothetical protein